ncbi:hypothetical protein [Mesonia sp. K7]|uniref:hypothetical protein n=1 Tax=Mesonia sp. K7 TaxID=2218606 RepID=UPI000DAA258E|nr:hypothetical protein [Mesonia sp. K7]PZD77145.1 hypothetical protein DNG35_09885 [Mesonia sp. K7]
MKKTIVLSVVLLLSVNIFAQTKDYNQFSLELNYGGSVPISPSNTDRSEAIGFSHAKAAMRYMWNKKAGMRGFYAYDRFGSADAGLSIHRLGSELVLNIDELLNFPYYIKENFGFQTHIGLGLGMAGPRHQVQNTSNDFIGFLIVGGGPQLKLSKRFSLYGDLSFNQLFQLNYGYDGAAISENSGNYANISLGLMLYLGRERHHADWH